MSDPDELTGDEVYQPQPDDSEVTDDAALMDPQDTLDDRGGDPAIDEGYSPPEKPQGVEKTGTTAAEQRQGETLDQRLAQERPDPVADERRAGRLIGTTETVPRSQGERKSDSMAATDAGMAGGAASAEEAAVHVVDDPELAEDPERPEDSAPADRDEP